VAFGLKGMDQVNNVGVGAESRVGLELLGELIDGQPIRSSSRRTRLQETLYSNQFIPQDVFGKVDHPEGAVVQKLDRLEASIEQDAILERISHTLHFGHLQYCLEGGGV
jgi:hypothetical protein